MLKSSYYSDYNPVLSLLRTHFMQLSLREISRQLVDRETTAVRLAEQTLANANQSIHVYTRINDTVLKLAAQIDRDRKDKSVSPLAGIPITLKDLFDVRGEVTLAGSKALVGEITTSCQDAEVVGYLREAGLLFAGRTNMSEFAFSGMGMNPHYGTPLSIWDRETGRLPGGSSSGSAVSVAEGAVAASMGSDTAGSCRIPAAFNGIVGVKPSYGRISLQGVYPLSPTSDAPGPLAVDVDSCFLMDRIISGQFDRTSSLPVITTSDLSRIKLALPDAAVMRDLDADVEATFLRNVEMLKAAGCQIETMPMPVLDEAMKMFMTRAVTAYEVWQAHGERIARCGDLYDPFVAKRMSGGVAISPQEQAKRYADKANLVSRFNDSMTDNQIDGVIYPTVAIVPPQIPQDLSIDGLAAVNFPCLKNTATVNYVDGCAISLPCHRAGQPPVGLMLSMRHGQDGRLYSIAAAMESVINGDR